MTATAYPVAAGRYSIGRDAVYSHATARFEAVFPRALLVHMAEGGGVVGYMSRPNRNGVTSEYACERSGRIVQLIDPRERAGTTVRVSAIRRTDDPPYTQPGGYIVRPGWTAARAVLGHLWQDPNRACIAIEVEGFAATGPNLAQRRALVLWARDMRERHPSLRGLLMHRDFAAYKACPGRLIPLRNMGGHGLWRIPR